MTFKQQEEELLTQEATRLQKELEQFCFETVGSSSPAHGYQYIAVRFLIRQLAQLRLDVRRLESQLENEREKHESS